MAMTLINRRLMIMRMMLIDDRNGHELDEHDKHEGDDGAWVDHHEVDGHVEDHYDHLQICKR